MSLLWQVALRDSLDVEINVYDNGLTLPYAHSFVAVSQSTRYFDSSLVSAIFPSLLNQNRTQFDQTRSRA